MEKEFVPYDRSLRMKALGFDEPCLGVFELIVVGDTVPKFRYSCEFEKMWFNHNKNKSEYETHDWYWSAPTFSQAFRWFREKYGLGHMINGIGYESFIMNIAGVQHIFNAFEFETYEEAELACLDKLLEIIETKSE
jgi:hypothetical protein